MKSSCFLRGRLLSRKSFILLVFLCNISVFGQNIIQIGPGEGEQLFPFCDSTNYSRSVTIYDKEVIEIIDTGLITRLEWYVNSPSSTSLDQITVYIKETEDDILDFLPWTSLIADAKKVIDKTIVNDFNQTGWRSILLDNLVFNRKNPEKNLMILCEYWGSKHPLGMPKFKYSEVDDYRHAAAASDAAAGVDYVSPVLPAVGKKRPDIRFTILSDPLNFNITTRTSNSLTLGWNSTDTVIIVRSNVNNFTSPIQGSQNPPPDPNSTFAGGEVVFKGSGPTFTNQNLLSNVLYYYKIFSYYGDNSAGGQPKYFYSNGVLKSESTIPQGGGQISFKQGSSLKIDTVICQSALPIIIYGSEVNGGSVKWLKSTNNQATWDTVSGAIGENYQIVESSLTAEKRTFFQRVFFAGQQPYFYSNIVSIYAYSPSDGGNPTITNPYVCQGTTGTITLSNKHGNVMRWEKKSFNSTTWIKINTTDTTVLKHKFSDFGNWKIRALVKSGSCDSVYSDSLTIHVPPNPQPKIQASPGSKVCYPDSITLSLTKNYSFYLWNGLGGSTASETVYKKVQEEKKTVKVTDQNGCIGFDSLNITIAEALVGGTVSADADSVCSGTNSTLLTLSGNSGVVQNWESSSDGTKWTVWSVTTKTYTAMNLKANTLFRVKLQSGPCTGYSGNAKINVVNGLAPQSENLVRKETNNSTELFLLCQNSQFINDSAKYYHFKWGYTKKNGQDFFEDVFINKYFCLFKGYQSTSETRYFVEMYAMDGTKLCSTRTYYEKNSTPIKSTGNFNIYPNPSIASFNVELDMVSLGEFELIISNIFGQECARIPMTKSIRTESFPISVPSLTKGTYLVRIKFRNGEQQIKKLVIL